MQFIPIKLVAIGLTALSLGSVIHAESGHSCSKITDNSARLACYDNVFGHVEPVSISEPAQKPVSITSETPSNNNTQIARPKVPVTYHPNTEIKQSNEESFGLVKKEESSEIHSTIAGEFKGWDRVKNEFF